MAQQKTQWMSQIHRPEITGNPVTTDILVICCAIYAITLMKQIVWCIKINWFIMQNESPERAKENVCNYPHHHKIFLLPIVHTIWTVSYVTSLSTKKCYFKCLKRSDHDSSSVLVNKNKIICNLNCILLSKIQPKKIICKLNCILLSKIWKNLDCIHNPSRTNNLYSICHQGIKIKQTLLYIHCIFQNVSIITAYLQTDSH